MPISRTSPLLIFGRPCYKWHEVKGVVPPRQQKCDYTDSFPTGYKQTTFKNSLMLKAMELSAEAALADGCASAAADISYARRAIRGPCTLVYQPSDYVDADALTTSPTPIEDASTLEQTMAKMPKVLQPFKDHLLLARVCGEWMVGPDYIKNALRYAPATIPDDPESAEQYVAGTHAEVLGMVTTPVQRIRFMIKAREEKENGNGDAGDGEPADA